MDIEQTVEYLTGQDYAIWTGGKLVLTNKFYRRFPLQAIGEVVSKEVVSKEEKVILTPKEKFQQFMEDAEVPFRVTTSQGAQYTVKTTSPTAIKSFTDALKRASYDDLVLATKWYYKQTKLMRKTIGNYFSEDIWMSALTEARKKGPEGSGPAVRNISLNR